MIIFLKILIPYGFGIFLLTFGAKILKYTIYKYNRKKRCSL